MTLTGPPASTHHPSLSSVAPASLFDDDPTMHALNFGRPPRKDKPPADYQGDECSFTLRNMDEFEQWRLTVERKLTVDFVRGDKHSSRSTPKAFKEHVKMVCARHSRSGRKPYEKKHPERQRRVPSRKVGGIGCPATISYRTYEDRDDVDVSYAPVHSHEIGNSNWEFTREGRRQMSANRNKAAPNRSPSVTDSRPLDMSATHSGVEPIDWLNTSGNHASSSQAIPISRPTLYTGGSAPADPNPASPFSSRSLSPSSVSPPHMHRHSPASAYPPLPLNSFSPAVSPTSSHTPGIPVSALPGTPGHPMNGISTPSYAARQQPLPPAPLNINGALSRGTPVHGTSGLPTPSHHGGSLPLVSPIGNNYQASPYAYTSYVDGYGSAQPSPSVYSPAPLPTPGHHNAALSTSASVHATPLHQLQQLSATPSHLTHELPSDASLVGSMLLQLTPAQALQALPSTGQQTSLHISTDLHSPYQVETDLYQGYDVDLSGMDYGPPSATSAMSGSGIDMLAVPHDPISLTVTGSPSLHHSPLTAEQQHMGMGLDIDLTVTEDTSVPTTTTTTATESASSGSALGAAGVEHYTGNIMDLRADRWSRMKNLFDAVHSASHSQHLPEDMVSRLEATVQALWTQTQAQRAQPAVYANPGGLGLAMNGVGSLLGLSSHAHAHRHRHHQQQPHQHQHQHQHRQ
ncbi:hypothetical protein BKA62DRAFT_173376 [Auriculariales sp. MPI-PUGE-AT-0066]|nr:hypothetical protein BKA62DRAFT_173376 [Auriculariales sp. MPI-PUGE-AT-0066]